MDPSFTRFKKINESNKKYLKSVKEQLITKVVTKINGVRRLPWDNLGLTMDNIMHVFIFYTDTSHIDWENELATRLDLGGLKIIILNKKSVDVYFGPMIKLLFAGSLTRDDETDPSN